MWEQEKYLLDPHTAVAWKVAAAYEKESGDAAPMIVLSTASPFKFADSVLKALGDAAPAAGGSFALLDKLSVKTGWPVPAGLAGLDKKPIRHDKLCGVTAMPAAVEDFALRF